jgi:hypothetical protein
MRKGHGKELVTREQSLQSHSGISPALYIGLGTRGAEMIKRLECSIDKSYGSLSDMPIVSFLRFQSPSPLEEPVAEISINVTERLGEAVEKSMHRDFLLTILPEAARTPLDINEGDLTRSHYRAGFYCHYDRIEKLCRDCLTDITAPEAIASAGELTSAAIDESVSIYIIASLFDRLSTGILWDLSHLLKNISSNLSFQTRLIAFLLYPDPEARDSEKTSEEEALNAITYAALSELKYFIDGGSFSLALPGTEAVTLKGNPFDFCYLLRSRSSSINLCEDEALDIIAHYISLDFDQFFSPKLKSAREQLMRYLNSPLLTCGASEISVPSEDIIDWCSKRLSHKALQQWGKKETSQPIEDLMKRFYKIMEINNPEKAAEEFLKKLGNPKETAWHLGRRLKELIEEHKKEQLPDKLDEEYRRIGAEEVAESSTTLQQKVREVINTQEKLFSRALLELASDCNVGLFKVKNIVTSLGSFLNRCHQSIDKKISETAVKLDELERKRIEHTKELRKIMKSPLLFLQKSRMMKIFDDTWQVCERSLEERLTLHMLTSALEYYLHMKEHIGRYREPVDSLIETYDLLSKQLDADSVFSPRATSKLSISPVDREGAERLYAHFAGCEEKTLCGVISSLLSLIPLDLTDLTNKRVLRDLRSNAVDAMHRKARLCFEAISEKPLVELLEELNEEEAYSNFLSRLSHLSSPHFIAEDSDSKDCRKIQLIGFFEGSYPQLDASVALVERFKGMGIEPSHIVDLKDERRIASLVQCSGISIDSFLGIKEWRIDFDTMTAKHCLRLWKESDKDAKKTETNPVAGAPSAS